MAQVVFSDSYSVSGWSGIAMNVRLTFTESYNSSTNKTTLTLSKIEFQKTGNTLNYGQLPVFGDVLVNGTTVCTISNTGAGHLATAILSGGNYVTANLSSVTINPVTVAHNDDGTCNVTVKINGYTFSNANCFCCMYTWTRKTGNGPSGPIYTTSYIPLGVRTSKSATMALTTRPRSSSISSCPSAVETQETFALSVSRNSSAFYHKATISIGGTTMYTSGAFATSLSYLIPRSWFSSHPNDAALTATVSVQTYSDSSCTTTVGSPVTQNFTVNADAGMKPSVSAGWVSISAYNTGAVSGILGFVKGYSQAAATFDSDHIDMSDAVGATISSYSVTCQGTTVSSSPYRSPVLTQNTLVCTVTDTRGRTASETFTVTLMDYSAPSLLDVTIFRCDANGDPDDSGTNYSAKATLTFSSLNSQNVCSFTAAHKTAGGSYGSGTSLTSGTASIIGPISADLSYTVKISATDSLGNTAEYYATIATRKWAMHFRPNGNGVAFGKAAETDDIFEIDPDWDVEIGGDLSVDGDVSFDHPLPIASGGTGADNAADALANLGAVQKKIVSSTAKTSHTINIPSTSAHLLLIYGGALTTYAVLWVAATSAGVVDVQQISKGSGVTISTGTNTVTIAYSSSRTLFVTDMNDMGDFCTLS